MKIKKITSVEIIPTSPFDFDSTFHKPDHFTSGDNYWKPGIRWQTFNFEGENLGVIFINTRTVKQARITVQVHCPQKLKEDYIKRFIEEIKYRYNLDLDLKPFYRQFEKDKTVGPIIQKWRGMRPGHPSSLYEYLIIGIVLQNATVKRSVQMFRNLLEKYGEFLEFNGQKLWCFWKPGSLKNVSEEELRSLKVGYRAKSIKIIDDYFARGEIDEMKLRERPREEQMTELLKLFGVGPATVWYLLFDVFHHWDFFNHVSPWEQKIYSKLFFNKDPENPVPVEKLLMYFERYGEYKQLAVHYIWEDLWWKRKNKKIPWLEKLIKI